MGRTTTAINRALRRFAERLRSEQGAGRVLLFGSHGRGEARPDSDYDIIVVSPLFAGVEPARRGIGLRDLWYQSGGAGPMDLICLTPEEFEQAQNRITLVAAVLPDAVDLLSPAAN